MNPRAAINDLLPFQGSPFNHLGTSAMVDSTLLFKFIILCPNGESGIRTHAPLRTNGFQDRLVMTTSISLQMCFQILSKNFTFVKNFFLLIYHFFGKKS